MNRQNHKNEQSRGVSGIGLKVALCVAGRKDGHPKSAVIYTRQEGDTWWRLTIPWDRICEDGVFTKQCIIEEMTADEIDTFKLERNHAATETTGTTVKIVNSSPMENCLKANFGDINDDTDPTTLISFIFGKDDRPITYQYKDKVPSEPKFYNYLTDKAEEYHVRETSHIDVYRIKDQEEYVWRNDDKLLHVSGTDKRTSTSVVQFTPRRHEHIKVATFQIDCGLRKDKNNIPKDGAKYIGDYDKDFGWRTEFKKFCAIQHSALVYRNKQFIGPIQIDITDNSRAGYSSKIESLMRVEISYVVESFQGNDHDAIMGIQENKNQFDNKKCKKFTRILKAIRKKYADDYLHKYPLPEPIPTCKTPAKSAIIVQEQPQAKSAISVQEQPRAKSAIIVQEQPQAKSAISVQEQPRAKSAIIVQEQPRAKSAIIVQEQPRAKSAIIVQEQPQAKSAISVQEQPQAKSAISVQEQPQAKSAISVQEQSQAKSAISVQEQPQAKSAISVQEQPQAKSAISVQEQPQAKSDIIVQEHTQAKSAISARELTPSKPVVVDKRDQQLKERDQTILRLREEMKERDQTIIRLREELMEKSWVV
jgi:hypothetical protein